MKDPECQRLVLAAYEAAGSSDAWRNFLRDYTTALGADTAWFGHQSIAGSAGVGPCVGFEDEWVLNYRGHYHQHNVYIPRMGRLPVGVALDADSIVSRSEVAKSTFYSEFLVPQQLQSAATASVLERDELEVSVLAFQWRIDRAAHAAQDSLPFQQRMIAHIRAALRLHDRIVELEQEKRDLLSAFDVAGLAVVLCDQRGEVLALSSAAEAIIARRDAIAYRNRRLVTLHRTGLGDALERMIKEVLQLRDGASETAPPVLRLRRRGTEFSYHVSAFPLVGYEADSWERRCRIVLFIQDPERPAIPNARVLQQLFTLTDREARTVALLAEGQRVACIAETLGVTRETVKSHLAAAFRKTETHCQGELVACVLKHLGSLAPKA